MHHNPLPLPVSVSIKFLPSPLFSSRRVTLLYLQMGSHCLSQPPLLLCQDRSGQRGLSFFFPQQLIFRLRSCHSTSRSHFNVGGAKLFSAVCVLVFVSICAHSAWNTRAPTSSYDDQQCCCKDSIKSTIDKQQRDIIHLLCAALDNRNFVRAPKHTHK